MRSRDIQALGIVGGTEKPNTRTETYTLIYISITVTSTNCEGGSASQEQHMCYLMPPSKYTSMSFVSI